MKPLSLHLRLVLAASLVLAAFLGLTGWALDNAYRKSAENAMQEQLQGHIYALLAAADEDELGRMYLPPELPDPRFSSPDSGLYAQVVGNVGDYQWQSASLVGQQLNIIHPSDAGEWHYEKPTNHTKLYTVNFSVIWEDKNNTEHIYSLAVGGDIAPLLNQIQSFRTTLWTWLGGVALLLLFAQAAVLQWGLKPLRIVTRELNQIENGKADKLSGGYPSELQQLTGNINSLIHHSQASQERYRNSLGDLAHSLKTPLAVLQGAAEAQDARQLQAVAEEQIPRMNDIVQYQLQRAAAAGKVTLAKAIFIAPVIQKIIRSLDKIYQDKGIAHTVTIDEQAHFFGTEGDLMEVFGNLLDNAYKYGKARVNISAEETTEKLIIHIEDDGAGIPVDKIDTVIKRGQRADEQQSGQGIGLSAAYEIIHLHQGKLKINKSKLGGVEIIITFNQ
ncbi:ATP-binding protein [Pseudomonadota bacterium]